MLVGTRDEEPLFGECGEGKLIVSVTLGNSAVFSWRRQSCPDDEGHLCWLGHGDILVMNGQMHGMSFFIVRILARNRNGSTFTFRWVKQHVSSCPLFRTCQRMRRVFQFLLWGILAMAFFFCFLASLVCLVCLGRREGGEVLVLLHWRERQAAHKTAYKYFCICLVFFYLEALYMLALAGQPSLHGYDACMVYWTQGAHRRICRQIYGETSLSPSRVLALVDLESQRPWACPDMIV